MNDCCFNHNKDITEDIILGQMKAEIEKLKKDTTLKLLIQDGKIAETCVYIRENLSYAIAEMLRDMKLSGEMTEIITDVLLLDVLNEIERTNAYYDGVTCDKIFDTESSTYYYLTKIPTKDDKGVPIQLQMGIANDDEACTTLEGTLKHAWRKNATLCVNCGVWNVDTGRPIASVIYKGEILYRDIPTVTPEKYQYLAITGGGDIRVYPIGTTPESMLSDGVYFACPIFASLLLGGTPVTQTDIRREPRQSIGVMADGTINIISCDGRNYESQGMTYDDLARVHALNGSINAYILDGGGSTSTVLRGVKQNENIDNFTTDRSVVTFLYVAKDTNVSVSNNYGNDLGRVKQFIMGQLRGRTDFFKGFIRIRGAENYYAPGIELYVNGEASRRSKWGLSFDHVNPRNTYLYFGLKSEDTENTRLLRVYDRGVLLETYHGTPAERPNAPIGACFFDETKGKPTWWNGTNWVDATGTIV